MKITKKKIEDMIGDLEKKGYAAEFHGDLETLAQIEILNQTSKESLLMPPLAPGKPWRLMGRDFHVVTDRKLELTPTAKKPKGKRP